MVEAGTVGRQAILASVSRAANAHDSATNQIYIPSYYVYMYCKPDHTTSKIPSMTFPLPENAVREPVRPRPVDPVPVGARRRLARRIHLGVNRIVAAGDLTGLEERQEQCADFVRRKEMSPDRAIDQMSLLIRNGRSA